MSTFGERLALLRTEHQVSQKKLADQINISKSALGMYETNQREPNFEIVVRIADLFDVSLDYLVGRTEHRGLAPKAIEERPKSLEKTLDQLTKDLQAGRYTLGGHPLTTQMQKFILAPLTACRSIIQAYLEQQGKRSSTT